MDDRTRVIRDAREIKVPSTFRFSRLSVSNGSSVFILLASKFQMPTLHGTCQVEGMPWQISQVAVLPELYSEAEGFAEIC
jgi:hypothetical protein